MADITSFISDVFDGKIANELTQQGRVLNQWQRQINALSEANKRLYAKNPNDPVISRTVAELAVQRNARAAAMDKFKAALDKYNFFATELTNAADKMAKVDSQYQGLNVPKAYYSAMSGLGAVPQVVAFSLSKVAIIGTLGVGVILALDAVRAAFSGSVSEKMTRLESFISSLPEDAKREVIDAVIQENKGIVERVGDQVKTLGIIALIGGGLYIGYGLLKKSGRLA